MKNLLISLMIIAMAFMGCVYPGEAGKGTAQKEAQGPGNAPQGAPAPENAPQGAPAPENAPQGAPAPENAPQGAPAPENVSQGAPALGNAPQADQAPGALAEKPPELVPPKSESEILAEKLTKLAAQPPELIPGAKYFYKRTNAVTDESQIIVSKIKNKVNWLGIPAYIVELSKKEGTNYAVTGYLVINTNLNTMATLDKDGKLLQAIKSTTSPTTPKENSGDSPCIKIYDWPLTLGKSFSVEYEIFNKADSKSFKLTDQVSIGNEWVMVKRAIGAWNTYRIHRITSGSFETHYYSPEIGIEVAQEISQTLDNPEGAGVFKVDLIGYNIPGVGQVGQAP
jgi:hypothetical protein